MSGVLREGLVLDPHIVIELAGDDGDEPSGVLAAALTAAFETARDGARELKDGGCIIFTVQGGEALRAGATGLVRSLALEWASQRIRVNAVYGEPNPQLVQFIASPASRMLTGAAFEQ
jgi:NAD(P)-dependent dehydrogenase (short-subunit alcohol dehydrogenase family)